SETELASHIAEFLPEKLRKTVCGEKPIETRPVNIINPLNPKKAEAKQYLWIRANGEMPENQLIHQYLLGYASDWGFLVTALFPHEVSLMTPNLQVATIDHSIWFHRPFKMDEWLLYAIESPTASNTRGLVRGEIYNQQGHLVATAVQEGVMRFTK
ncbi:acyl-CoA thioesterase II, partial [Vibrio astriarenae]